MVKGTFLFKCDSDPDMCLYVHCSHSFLDLPVVCDVGASSVVVFVEFFLGFEPLFLWLSVPSTPFPSFTSEEGHFVVLPVLRACLTIRAISRKVTFSLAFYACYLVLALHVPWDL